MQALLAIPECAALAEIPLEQLPAETATGEALGEWLPISLAPSARSLLQA